MMQTLRQYLILNRYDFDPVIVGDIPSRPETHAINEAKREKAISYLGGRWLLHPANRVKRLAVPSESFRLTPRQM